MPIISGVVSPASSAGAGVYDSPIVYDAPIPYDSASFGGAGAVSPASNGATVFAWLLGAFGADAFGAGAFGVGTGAPAAGQGQVAI